jgi:transposase-like protein
MRRKRRNHKPAFKAKVALAALKGDRTLSELSEQYDVHQNQIQDWRKRLLENADSVFGQGQQQQEEAAGQVKALHAKIGQLTMERDFLEEGLERIHGPSGKK